MGAASVPTSSRFLARLALASTVFSSPNNEKTKAIVIKPPLNQTKLDAKYHFKIHSIHAASELAAVIAMIALLTSMLLPALARTKAATQRINCTDNLKRINCAFQAWGATHSDLYPMRVPAASGGYGNFVGIRTITSNQATSRGVFGDFMVMSNELQSPHLLICPAENEARTMATTFSGVIPPGSTNVVPFTNDLETSYFIGVDTTSSTPAMFLAGDHNLGSDGNLTPLLVRDGAPCKSMPLIS